MDLKLTPYKVLATSTKHGKPTVPLHLHRGSARFATILTSRCAIPSGFMQFVQSVPVAEVLATEGNIQVSITRVVPQHAGRPLQQLFIPTELLQEARTQ